MTSELVPNGDGVADGDVAPDGDGVPSGEVVPDGDGGGGVPTLVEAAEEGAGGAAVPTPIEGRAGDGVDVPVLCAITELATRPALIAATNKEVRKVCLLIGDSFHHGTEEFPSRLEWTAVAPVTVPRYPPREPNSPENRIRSRG